MYNIQSRQYGILILCVNLYRFYWNQVILLEVVRKLRHEDVWGSRCIDSRILDLAITLK
jgi:hypothetical protein